jgi:hypothetical protein
VGILVSTGQVMAARRAPLALSPSSASEPEAPDSRDVGRRRPQPGLFTDRYGSIVTRKRNAGAREGVAKEVGVRARAPGVTPPKARDSQARLKLQ